MAGWYKQHTSELASLEAFAQCGRVDLVIAWLRITRWTVDHESDDLPATFAEDASKLDAVGLRPTFAARCKKLLDQREAMAAKRELKKHHVNSSELTSVHVSSSDHQDKTRQDKTKEEKKGGRATRAPKQPSKGRRALDAFNAAITEVTGSPSTTMGISMERKAVAMQDALDAAGETWTQAVKRRHDLGKSLNLHWMANDYASDRTMRQRTGIIKPNLSNNLLQTNDHPEGAGEEYWLAGINKYGGNHG
jgi:hypothetical protein